MQKVIAVSAVIMVFAGPTWAWSGGSRRPLVAAVVLSAVFGAVGGFFVEDGRPLQALKVSAAGAGMGLITWICAYGRRRDRA